MGIYNRSYWKEGDNSNPGGGGGLTLGLPPLGRVVKYLLMINLGVFLVQLVFDQRGGWLSLTLGATVEGWWQIYRYITFQFLHGGYWHIIMNMLGLYLLGSPLEQHWGSRRFLGFYLGCGVFAGIAYVAMSAAVNADPRVPIIGASGGVFGILLACAILFPQFRLIFLFFPVPIRLAAIIIFGGMIFLVLGSIGSGVRTSQFWSEIAHLGGAVAAALYIWLLPKFTEMRLKRASDPTKTNSGSWRRKMEKQAAEQVELDRILAKIHDAGIQSLTKKEQKLLRDATRRQQAQERELFRS